MLEIIGNEAAKKIGLNLFGNRMEVYREGRLIRASWMAGDGVFSLFTNGEWDWCGNDGSYVDGKILPPTRKAWITRLEKKGYNQQTASAAWLEWVALKRRKKA